jgi:2-phosphoglycerate kinase
MVERVGIAKVTTTTVSGKPPVLVLIAGTSGVGKSTTAVKLASSRHFSRLLSTDAIREIIRVSSPNENSALFRSSFSKGESGDPVIDWQETCLAIESGIEATIERARREGINLIIEGVHLQPSARILRSWGESGGISIGVVMCIEDKELHRDFIKQREENSFRRAERYLAALPRIRAIQENLITRAKATQWNILDPTKHVDPLQRIYHWLDLAWNENKG